MAYVVKRENESTESLIKRWRRKVQDEGIMQELKKRDHYLSPSQKRRRKSELAQARLRKKNRILVTKLDDEY